MGRVRYFLTGLMFLWAAVAAAQQYPVYEESLPVASINREELFQQSAYGQALIDQLQKRQQQLAAENDDLYANLEREERELTTLRKQISAEEFAPLAQAFDEKANTIRAQQRHKLDELNAELEKSRFTFFRRAEAVIRQLMAERGIVYVLHEQAIWVSSGRADITRDVMARMDALFAQGVFTPRDK